MSRADLLYRETCARILREGVWDTDQSVRPRWADGSPAHTVKCFGVVNRYDLQEEFPLMTLRRTYWRSCVEELLWIWQKKSNNVRDLGSHIWDSWADESGSIGKAYGYQLGIKYRFPEGEFDQVDRVLYDQYLKSAAAGAIILVSHILGALANGLLYRKRFVSVSECGRLISRQRNNGEILGDCMQNSIISVLSVGGFVTVFYMWTQMLLSLPPLSGAGKLVQGIAGGLLEVTAGCKILADTGSAPLTVVLCCFLISLGGLCIFLQSSVFYRKCGVGSGKIMLFKLTQAIFSAAFCTPLAFLFLK